MSSVDIRLLLIEQYEAALHRAWQKKDVDGALGAAQALLKVRQETLGPDHPEVANALYEVSEAFRLKRELDAAEGALRTALRIEAAQYGERHERYGEALHRLGEVLLQQAKNDEALRTLSRARAVLENALSETDTRVAMALTAEAALTSDPAEAVRLLERAARILERSRSPELPDVLRQLAQSALDAGELDSAETAAQQAVRMQVSPTPQRGQALEVLAEVLERRGKLLEAREQYRAALDLYTQALPAHHPQVGVASLNVATLELRLGEVEKATHLAEHSLRVFLDAFGPLHPHTRALCEALQRTFAKAGQTAAWDSVAQIIQVPV